MKALTLTRGEYDPTGVFGELMGNDNAFFCVTLEHAYPTTAPIGFAPKVPMGQYTCVRGTHQLEGMAEPFETFEITNVMNHSGILFHCGNVNADSEGCVLLGLYNDNDRMIVSSREAFKLFMNYLAGESSFQLTVK